jgi:hypothetical protein
MMEERRRAVKGLGVRRSSTSGVDQRIACHDGLVGCTRQASETEGQSGNRAVLSARVTVTDTWVCVSVCVCL